MKLRYLIIVTWLWNASSFAGSQVWLFRCTASGTKLNTLTDSMITKKINVLNSIERNDAAIAEHCASGEKLQAFRVWQFQTGQAKALIPELKDAPANFDPMPPKRVH